jgi:hypothetical protein
MELSENERLMLIKKKEEIFEITSEIIKTYEPRENQIEIKNKLNQILSLLSTMAGYAKPDRDLNTFTKFVIDLSINLDTPGYDTGVSLQAFCTIVNSIKFDITKKGLIISIPLKIEAILNKNQFG